MSHSQSESVRGLYFPYGRKYSPALGEPMQVADGVYWVRLPMPFSLDHINIWLLRDGDGWAVVDTSLDIPQSRELWQNLFDSFLKGSVITRVICTHMHPDHVGLAGWLCEQYNCRLLMSRDEYLLCRLMAADTGRPAPEPALDFYRTAGYTKEQLNRYSERFGDFGRAIAPLPDSYIRLQHNDTLIIDNRYWQVVVTAGHSPEHVMLYCPALKLLISGDQVLPRITPNVSVFPTEPLADPLTDWLRSCARIRDSLPEDVLVLPSHEAPFYGLHQRITQIIEGHKTDLQSLYEHLESPRRAVDCFSALFKRDIGDSSLGLATGETIAHLNCLLSRRQIARWRDREGISWYHQRDNKDYHPPNLPAAAVSDSDDIDEPAPTH